MMAAIIPSAPQSISKVAATASSITVSWTAPADNGGTSITGYKVYYNGGGSSTTFTEVATVAGSVFEYTHASLSPPGDTFAYKVSAVNYIGEGPQSNSVSIVAATVPDAPATPVRTGSTLTSISISWSAPANGGSPILNYKLFMNAGTGSATYSEIDTVSSSTFAYTKFSLTTGQNYKFRVLAVNTVG
jgi:hypothetical protein